MHRTGAVGKQLRHRIEFVAGDIRRRLTNVGDGGFGEQAEPAIADNGAALHQRRFETGGQFRAERALERAVTPEAELGDHAKHGRSADIGGLAEAGDGIQPGDRIIGQKTVRGAPLVRRHGAEVAADQFRDGGCRIGRHPRFFAPVARCRYFRVAGFPISCNVYSTRERCASRGCVVRSPRSVVGVQWTRCCRPMKGLRSRSARGAGRSSSHASTRRTVFPRALGTLGLAPVDLQRHIAWDPGAADVAVGLKAELGGDLVLQRFSRLVIDCNRAPELSDAITTLSEDTEIPGNVGPLRRGKGESCRWLVGAFSCGT